MKLHRSKWDPNLSDQYLDFEDRSCKEQDKEDNIFHQDNYSSQFHLLLSLELDIQHSNYLIQNNESESERSRRNESIDLKSGKGMKENENENWKGMKKKEWEKGYQK